MIKEIKYNGITTVPSDYSCADGDSALLLNLIPEDGAIKPVMPPKTVLQLENDTVVKYIHNTSSAKNYIIIDEVDKRIIWVDEAVTKVTTQNSYELTMLETNETLYQISSIGNTLLILTSKGVNYFLWENNAEGYKSLGNHLPEIPLSFGLKGELKFSKKFNVSDFSLANNGVITDEVLAKVNKFITDEAVNKGRFMYPFFVRYALRLYDGTLTMHSAPILMLPSSFDGKAGAPLVAHKNSSCYVYGVTTELDFAVVNMEDIEKIKEWRDIVSSVDIFISAPLYTYNLSGQVKSITTTNTTTTNFGVYKPIIPKLPQQNVGFSKYQVMPLNNHYKAEYENRANVPESEAPYEHLLLPSPTLEEYNEKVSSCGMFYLLASYTPDKLTTERKTIPVAKDYLESLVTREVMTDDYDSHDLLVPKYAYNYNARINVCNLSKVISNGMHPASAFPFTDGYVARKGTSIGDGNAPWGDYGTIQSQLFFVIEQDGKEIIVGGNTAIYGNNMGTDLPHYIFYPNINAKKAILKVPSGAFADKTGVWKEFPLKPHSTLNGAYYCNINSYSLQHGEPLTDDVTQPMLTTDRIINLQNKIYTSEVNNPFVFPVTNITTVGSGKVIGLSTAAKALSQGQFGQFPLYAFSDEGVWALEVSGTGTYNARQPITRDVCRNENTITQIDSAVLFASDRGIMLLHGSETICISDVLSGMDNLPIKALPLINTIIKRTELPDSTFEIISFQDFVKECRMMYDYPHQRIIVYNPDTNYAYIYSLKSKQWGMMQSDIKGNVNSYPNAMAMVKDDKLVNFSDETDGEYKNILISRPMKLDADNIHKTVDTVIQRGLFKAGHVQSILYASNDLFFWTPVWTSQDHCLRGFRGTPYKYFRIALITDFDSTESITGATVQFTPRMNNQLR